MQLFLSYYSDFLPHYGSFMQIFERRAKHVKKGREADHWQFITPDMMSDKEKCDSGYIRHQPDYRSNQLNTFLQKLDERSDRKNSFHARFSRNIGSPVSKPVPINAKPWMLKEKSNAPTNCEIPESSQRDQNANAQRSSEQENVEFEESAAESSFDDHESD